MAWRSNAASIPLASSSRGVSHRGKMPFPRALALLALVSIAACSKGSSSPAVTDAGGAAPGPNAAPAPSSSSSPSASAPAASTVAPQLASADGSFVDARHGFGWGDRCFAHYQAGDLASARAACDRGLALPDLDPGARPALLYNEGLIAAKAGDVATARSDYTQSLVARPAGEAGRPVVEKALVALGGTPPAPAPVRSPLECSAKGAGGTFELFLDWTQNVATGWLRTTHTSGAIATQAVDAELYKGLVLVNPAGAPDPKSRIATEQTMPTKSLQVGDDKQPWLSCQASASPACTPGWIDACGGCYKPCETDAECNGKGRCQPVVCTHTPYGNGCVTE
jgi:hypothetical protein